jgi:hypothetical protein
MKRSNFLILIIFVLGFSSLATAQSYTEMTEREKIDFVTGKLDEVTTKISGHKYAFSLDFKLQVVKNLDTYQKRVGNNHKNVGFNQDLNLVFQRGSEFAPTINKAFDKIGISRLAGLYIAMIESEFNNDIKGPTGASGLFQINSLRANKYGLPIRGRGNVEKTADLTARYLKVNQQFFERHKMKEFLAILSWNREPKKINFDINFKFMSDSKNMACPICGLTENPNRFDQQFQMEAVKYIPKFLAAVIIGENPGDFGLTTKPLSTLD